MIALSDGGHDSNQFVFDEAGKRLDCVLQEIKKWFLKTKYYSGSYFLPL